MFSIILPLLLAFLQTDIEHCKLYKDYIDTTFSNHTYINEVIKTIKDDSNNIYALHITYSHTIQGYLYLFITTKKSCLINYVDYKGIKQISQKPYTINFNLSNYPIADTYSCHNKLHPNPGVEELLILKIYNSTHIYSSHRQELDCFFIENENCQQLLMLHNFITKIEKDHLDYVYRKHKR